MRHQGTYTLASARLLSGAWVQKDARVRPTAPALPSTATWLSPSGCPADRACFVLGSDWCQLGNVLGIAAVLSAESDQGGMTHPETSMKDDISSLRAALVPAFHP